MAKIVFLQQLNEEWLGPMYMSSSLKAAGHSCDIFVEFLEKEDFLDNVLSQGADIVAFSCLTSDFFWALGVAEKIKKRSQAIMLFGGTHITLNPDQAIGYAQVDVICLGEGEKPITELADALDRDYGYPRIKNLWLKNNGRVLKNDIRNLVEDLDSLPFPDRELYVKYDYFKKRGKRPIHLGRGCPFDCSHCHNASKRAFYKGKGRYVRWRRVEGILAEIENVVEKNYIEVLHFIDDSFGVNQKWLETFIGRLTWLKKRKISLQANMRADKVTESLCDTFKEYGEKFLRLRIAVECGDEDYRKRILKKNITNETLLQAARLLRRHNINFITYNMVGLPGETLAQALETLHLNILLKPQFALCFIYQPFPGTDLSNYALTNHFLPRLNLDKLGMPDFKGYYHSKSPMRQDDIREIENLHKLFSFTAKHPLFLPIVRRLVRFKRWASGFEFFYKIYMRLFLLRRKMRDKY